MWGAEEGRAAVIAFNPDGSNRRVFATGLRNCSGLDHPAGDRRPVVRGQRARRARRQRAERLRHARAGRPFLRLALVLHRRQRGSAQAAEGPAPGPRRPGDRAGRPVPGPFGAAQHQVLRRRHVSGRVQGRRLRRHARLVEPRQPHRLQDRPAEVRERHSRRGAYEDFVTGFVLSADQVWGRPVGLRSPRTVR